MKVRYGGLQLHSVLDRLLRQLQYSIRRLTKGPKSDNTVHSIRKTLKRARATLRLLRNAIGREAYRRANFQIRDAARPLSAVRDAKVLMQTWRQLRAGDGGRRTIRNDIALNKLLFAERRRAQKHLVRRDLNGAAALLRSVRANLEDY